MSEIDPTYAQQIIDGYATRVGENEIRHTNEVVALRVQIHGLEASRASLLRTVAEQQERLNAYAPQEGDVRVAETARNGTLPYSK
jgi:hypothetical protein